MKAIFLEWKPEINWGAGVQVQPLLYARTRVHKRERKNRHCAEIHMLFVHSRNTKLVACQSLDDQLITHTHVQMIKKQTNECLDKVHIKIVHFEPFNINVQH